MRTLARYGLCLLLAGCTAQASVNEGNNMDPTQIKMVGREVVVPNGENASVLDWRSDDHGAEEITISVGLARPAFNSEATFVVLASPLDYYVTNNLSVLPYFMIEYGIEGATFRVIVDAYPEQSFTVPASFVRIVALNKNTQNGGPINPSPPLTFVAMVSRGVGKAPGLARWSLRRRVANLFPFTVPVQPYARKLQVNRVLTATDLPGAIEVYIFGPGPNGTIARYQFAAGVEAPLIDIPGVATSISVINMAAQQDMSIIQHLDP